MKKFLLAAVAIFATLTASAQLYVGGSFGLNRNTTENTTVFNIEPEIGYNFNDTWSFGATIGYGYNYNDGLKTDVFEISPYARWNFFSCVDNRLKLFVDGGFGIGGGKSKFEDNSSDTVVLFNIGFKPGVSFALNEHFSLVTHLGFFGYEGGNDAAKDAKFPEKFGIDLSSLNLTFGFYYTF